MPDDFFAEYGKYFDGDEFKGAPKKVMIDMIMYFIENLDDDEEIENELEQLSW